MRNVTILFMILAGAPCSTVGAPPPSAPVRAADAGPDAGKPDDAAAQTIAPPPNTKHVKEWAARHLDKRMLLQQVTVAGQEQTFLLLVAYQPLADWNEDTVVPADVRGGARLFLFLSREPVEIKGHGFYTPDDPNSARERPYVNCGPAKLYYLSSRHDPTLVAQACSEDNEHITRFIVFGAANLQQPAIGRVTSRPGSIDTVSPRERFVPADEPWMGGRSSYRGDGKTLVDGQEIERTGTAMRTRNYRIEWDGSALHKVSAAWRPFR